MKTAFIALFIGLTSAHAGTDFGGINFHSSVPAEQKNLLKQDLRYLFKQTKPDQDLQNMLGVKAVNGTTLHHFLVNRVHTIVGESFDFQNQNLLQKEGHAFPKTPLPNMADATVSIPPHELNVARVVMSNLGTALYLGGKANAILLGLKIDRERLYATSPRVGILQVGEGLFAGNDHATPMATISRLGTLFHESRHSDGTGKSTGFVHTLCPAGHAYEGKPACDQATNGPYTLGAMVERYLLQNCSNCSEIEQTVLAAGIADDLSRVLKVSASAEVTQLRGILNTYINTRDLYQQMLSAAQGERRTQMEAEITKLNAKISQTETRLAQAEANQSKEPPIWDATPEGSFLVISPSTAQRMLQKALRERP